VLGDFTLPDPSNPTEIVIPATLLRPGVNTLEFLAVSEGFLSPATLGIRVRPEQTVQNTVFLRSVSLNQGDTFAFTGGFPQIALCMTNVRFPCIGAVPTPESGRHILEARGNPPSRITAPLKPGRIGNPLRDSYPALLTYDRNQANKRRRRRDSTDAYMCPIGSGGRRLDRDEYPPATFVENDGEAHIKCVLPSDNQNAGSFFGGQLQRYRIAPLGPAYAIGDGDTIEFVILR
jgi:hypothetical protein